MSCKPRTSFASEAAIHALTTVAHPRRAVNALVHRDYERFDAPTGDASCHARTPVVSDAAQIIEGYIAERRRERALALVKSYEYLHANDPADGRVKAPSDLQNEDRGSPVYGWFFAEVAALLGREHLALLSAFYSKKVDCTRTYTVFDTSIARRDHLVYYGTTAEAEATKNPRLRIDMGSPLEVAVEQGNVDYIYRRFNDGILPGLTDDDSTQHQTSRALAEHRAKIALPNQQTYEVGQVFDLFLTVFYLDWQARRPLIVSVRRIQLDDAGSLTWEGAEVLPGLVVVRPQPDRVTDRPSRHLLRHPLRGPQLRAPDARPARYPHLHGPGRQPGRQPRPL